ncbi:FAD-binding oxidoreductase [Actinoplanes solisilvae]|uniref:FAD-binding oxidoreductase n=1 Tax=Actinoplanes solisilvae TaxID=2486853 RepID=UPI000FD92EE8|nr:FAD-binding oxidoreductase [Actinoplanes solisilvae]
MSKDSGASALRGAAREVHLPGDEGYDQARSTWSLGADLHPAAVVFATSADEISAVVRTAAAEGLRVSAMGTGHNAHPFNDLDRTVMLRTSRMNGFSIDADKRSARTSAGTLWLPVVEGAAGHGLSALHGSAPDVSVAGFTVGGGVGFYSREYGLASSHVTAAELVLADGTQVRVDANQEPDLFWAVRGGGGSFGIVTALEFGLVPHDTAYAGFLAWDLSQAPEVFARWLEWTASAPTALTTTYRHLRFPPIPQLPEPFRGRNLVMIDGAVLGDDALAARTLAPLRELKPVMDTFGRVPSPAVARLHMDPEEPTNGETTDRLLDALPAAAVDRLMAVSGPDSGSTVFTTEVRHFGGALGRPASSAGALTHLDAQYMVQSAGAVFDPAQKPAVVAEIHGIVDAMSEWSRDRVYLNFAQEQGTTSRAFDSATWQRLLSIREKVDPNGVLRPNHEVV